METKTVKVETILSFLRKKNVNIDVYSIAKTDPETLARCMKKSLMDMNYIRQNMCKGVLALINKAPTVYRGIAWEFIQEIQLSHLLEIVKIMDKKDNSKRLRHALVVKIANASKAELLRAFFMMHGTYQVMFKKLYLPREIFNVGKEKKKIMNETYQLAYKLSRLSLPKAIEELELTLIYILRDLNLPLERIMQLVTSPKEAREIAEASRSDTYFQHCRWFRNVLGNEIYEEIGLKKVKYIKNPLTFLTKNKKEHLKETEAFTDRMFESVEKQASVMLEEIMREFKLDRIALLVDLSGSMDIARDITIRLYEAFSRTQNITDLIGFADNAYTLTLERLRNQKPHGYTSIKASIQLLNNRLIERKNLLEKTLGREKRDKLDELFAKEIPQAIILVSDLEENVGKVNNAFPLLEKFGNPPLIVLHCGRKDWLDLEYPHAIIEVDEFHPSLIMNVMKEIARLTSKVAIKEKEDTKILKERRPIEEDIGKIELPERPTETYKPGYLGELLCPK